MDVNRECECADTVTSQRIYISTNTCYKDSCHPEQADDAVPTCSLSWQHLDDKLSCFLKRDVVLEVLFQDVLCALTVCTNGSGFPAAIVATWIALIQLETICNIPAVGAYTASGFSNELLEQRESLAPCTDMTTAPTYDCVCGANLPACI